MPLILLSLFSCVIDTSNLIPSNESTIVNVNNNINTGSGEYTRTNKDSRFSCNTKDNPKITPETLGVRFQRYKFYPAGRVDTDLLQYDLIKMVHKSGLVIYHYKYPNVIGGIYGCPDSTQWSMKRISISLNIPTYDERECSYACNDGYEMPEIVQLKSDSTDPKYNEEKECEKNPNCLLVPKSILYVPHLQRYGWNKHDSLWHIDFELGMTYEIGKKPRETMD